MYALQITADDMLNMDILGHFISMSDIDLLASSPKHSKYIDICVMCMQMPMLLRAGISATI